MQNRARIRQHKSKQLHTWGPNELYKKYEINNVQFMVLLVNRYFKIELYLLH